MFGLTLLIVAFSSFSLSHGQLSWALLAAGSNGYSNYRHQADICHSYHVLIEHGFARERIIVMMYDDIAYNKRNPVSGNIINQPNGPNVYRGVHIDYSGSEVTADTFLKVLTGDAVGISRSLGHTGKVIKSGSNDRIFVVYSDHGAPGYLAFPTGGPLYASQLNNAITKMHSNKQYNQMVLYIEACFSGSMFDGILASNVDVYVTTAANPHESSYSCYYDSTRHTYLGDLYSVNWMQDSDQNNLNVQTLNDQYKVVKKKTTLSHVMQYGDSSMGALKLSLFQGSSPRQTNDAASNNDSASTNDPAADAIPSEDVDMILLERAIANATGDEADQYTAALNELKERRSETDDFFEDMVELISTANKYEFFLTDPVDYRNDTCYQEAVRLIMTVCPGMQLTRNYYALTKLQIIANLCEDSGIPKEEIWAAIGKTCYERQSDSEASNSNSIHSLNRFVKVNAKFAILSLVFTVNVLNRCFY